MRRREEGPWRKKSINFTKECSRPPAALLFPCHNALGLPDMPRSGEKGKERGCWSSSDGKRQARWW